MIFTETIFVLRLFNNKKRINYQKNRKNRKKQKKLNKKHMINIFSKNLFQKNQIFY